MTLQVDAQDNLDVGLRLCGLSSPFHRVRSSHIYENKHLYSLRVSDSLIQFMYSLYNHHRYTEYGCQLVITLPVYQRLDLFLLYVLEASWNGKFLPPNFRRIWSRPLGYTTIVMHISLIIMHIIICC